MRASGYQAEREKMPVPLGIRVLRGGVGHGGKAFQAAKNRVFVALPSHLAVSYCPEVRRVTSLNQGWEFSCAAWQKAPTKVGFSSLEWQKATVPGHVHLDLEACGIIANPFERLFELGCQWVDEQDWHYRTEFEFEPDPTLPKRILRFEGLDTVCQICLNGQVIGHSDNMFVAFEIDVTNNLIAGKNVLRVEFESAWRVGRARRERYFEVEGLPATTVRFEPWAFVRKSQYMFGWDWGPCLVSAGVWRPVELIECAARIIDVAVLQRHTRDGAVELELRSEFTGSGQVFHFVQGFEAPIRDGETLRIESPQLWWPRDLGTPTLYEITSLLVDFSPLSRQDSELALDRRVQRVGLRSITLVREPDAYGESFRFVVNGRNWYAFGANWIPDDSFPSRVDRQRLEAQLRSACDLGMNMLRVWGGGHYESDDLFALCDELGLMVWQDFPYACSYYPDDPAACDVARREASAAVRRLRNHPSLALWCGNNENQTMRDCGWDGAAHHPPRFHGERIYDGVLPSVLKELDPSRPYIPSSPTGRVKANSDGDGDQHFWDVWHGRGDWGYYADSKARFCSEFGFASAPSRAVWQVMTRGTDLLATSLLDPVARWHDKTGKGHDTFIKFVELHYPKSDSVDQWSYYSQLNQRDALRFGIEHFRRSEFCRGTLLWQLNDCWPVQSWSVIDSAFCYKAAAFELRRLYAPLLLSLERRGDVVHVWGILDNVSAPVDATYGIEVRSLADGQLLERRESTLQFLPGERRVLEAIDVAAYDPTQTIVTSVIDSRSGFLLLCEPKELRMQPSELLLRQTPDGILVETSGPVIDLWLGDEGNGCQFTDNFVTQAAAGRRLLRARGCPEKLQARSLAGVHRLNLEK